MARDLCFSEVQQQMARLPEDEHVQYLLDVIEQNIPWLSPQVHPVDSWGLPFPPVVRRAMIVLYENAPRVVEYNHLISAVASHYLADGEVPGVSAARQHARRARKILPPEIGRIETVPGIGYRFVPAGV